MNYVNFLIKKTIKDRSVSVILVVITLISLGCLFFNYQNRTHDTLSANTREQIIFQQKQLKPLEKETPSEANQAVKEQRRDINYNQQIMRSLAHHRWATAYQLQIRQNQKLINSERQTGNGQDDSLTHSLIQENRWYTALKRLNVLEISETNPTTGIGFTLWLEKFISPILLTLVIILICTQLFTKQYVGKLDKASLLPLSELAVVNQSILSGLLIALGAVILVLGLSFVVASLISGIGNFQYPWGSYQLKTHAFGYVFQGTALGKGLLLQILSVLFIVCSVNLIAKVLKQTLPTLFIAILSLVGMNMLIPIMAPLADIAHWLPMTYFSGADVVSHKLAVDLGNNQITWMQGCLTLMIGTVVVLVVTMELQYWNGKSKQHLNHF
ncbi:hypothetical protein [Lentilactobacillus senioris]|uniref:hypothetical protein n=1 Tax=Lentilactobacillus senioris TaxID=931534 RepID=UPI000704B24E|nr:hypothetical protein [Lentilactobacillus senioris]